MLRSSTCGTDTTGTAAAAAAAAAATTRTGDASDFGTSATDVVGGISGGVSGALAGRTVDGTAGLVLANRTPSYWTPFISRQTISWGSPVSVLAGNAHDTFSKYLFFFKLHLNIHHHQHLLRLVTLNCMPPTIAVGLSPLCLADDVNGVPFAWFAPPRPLLAPLLLVPLFR